MLCSKYGGFGSRWSSLPVVSGMMSILWQDVLLVNLSNPVLSAFFFNNVKTVVGNGRMIQFWVNRWFSNQSLSEVFPRLFSLSTEKGKSLIHFVQRKGEGRNWKLASICLGRGGSVQVECFVA